MSSYQFPLSRVSFSNPRLIPAGTSPKSIKWDTYSNCVVKISLDGGSVALLEVTEEGGAAMMPPRCFAPITTVFHPAVRKITHTEKQAAFRYDWPFQPSPSDAVRTQECFQMVFNDPSGLIALIGHLSPFFTLQASTAKPITVTTNASSQSQSSGSKSGAAPTVGKPKAKPKPKAPPKSKVKASAKPTASGSTPAPIASAPASQSIATLVVPTAPAYSSTSTASLTTPSSSAQPQRPTSTTEHLMTADLKRKLLEGFVPSASGSSRSQGEAAKINPGVVQANQADCQADQTAIPYQRPSITPNFPPHPHSLQQLQPQPQLQPHRPAEKSPSTTRSLQRTPTVVDLITFSPLIPSHIAGAGTDSTHPTPSASSANPAHAAPVRMLLGGSSYFTLEHECVNAEYPVMLTDAAENELVKVKLEEEDLDVEPFHGCPAMDAYGHCMLGGHASHSHALATFTDRSSFLPAMSVALLYGRQIFDASEDELRAVMGEVMHDERFAELCARVVQITSQSDSLNEQWNVSQYIDSGYASAESYPTYYTGCATPYQHTQAPHMLPSLMYEYNHLQEYGDELEAYGHARKRVKVEDEEFQVVEFDDLAEEEAGMVDDYGLHEGLELRGVSG